jgi:hypothetical protein
MTPPPYPRIAHLLPGRGTRDDLELSVSERHVFLQRPVVVEEKLDGANVALWWQDGWIACAGRSGPDGQDRARQLGPLRAWAAEHVDQLRPVLTDDVVLYAEWLLLTHAVAYDRLPSYLVGLDLRLAGGTFATVDERNGRLDAAGVSRPPELFRGVLGSLERLETILTATSRVGSAPIEGVVVRTLDGREPRVAKALARGFAPVSDDEWQGGRPRNRVVASTWR